MPVTNTQRAAELHTLFDDLLSRAQRPTWITGRDVYGEACVRLTWADVELLRARCRRPWYRRALTAINKWLCDT